MLLSFLRRFLVCMHMLEEMMGDKEFGKFNRDNGLGNITEQ
jgi:CRISPR/Cas system endoribonuclease Cas6 (RAMP superfamily)